MSDGHISFPADAFPPGKLVKGRILSIDAASGHINLSLRPSVVNPRPLLSFADFAVGQKVKGEVRNVKPFGVFVRLKRSQVDGLAHISECSDDRVDDLGRHYKQGDRVQGGGAEEGRGEEEGQPGPQGRSNFEDETEEEKAAALVDSDDEDEDVEDGSAAPTPASSAAAVNGHATETARTKVKRSRRTMEMWRCSTLQSRRRR